MTIRIIFLRLPWLFCGYWITEDRSGTGRARVAASTVVQAAKMVPRGQPHLPALPQAFEGAHGLPLFAPPIRSDPELGSQ